MCHISFFICMKFTRDSPYFNNALNMAFDTPWNKIETIIIRCLHFNQYPGRINMLYNGWSCTAGTIRFTGDKLKGLEFKDVTGTFKYAIELEVIESQWSPVIKYTKMRLFLVRGVHPCLGNESHLSTLTYLTSSIVASYLVSRWIRSSNVLTPCGQACLH